MDDSQTSPQSADSFVLSAQFPRLQRHPTIDIRDDDPLLASDPTPNDGFKRLSFTDPVANGPTVQRFIRLKFTNGQ